MNNYEYDYDYYEHFRELVVNLEDITEARAAKTFSVTYLASQYPELADLIEKCKIMEILKRDTNA